MKLCVLNWAQMSSALHCCTLSRFAWRLHKLHSISFIVSQKWLCEQFVKQHFLLIMNVFRSTVKRTLWLVTTSFRNLCPPQLRSVSNWLRARLLIRSVERKSCPFQGCQLSRIQQKTSRFGVHLNFNIIINPLGIFLLSWKLTALPFPNWDTNNSL